MSVTTVVTPEDPEPAPVVVVDDPGPDPAEVVEGAAELAQVVIAAGEVAAEQARQEAIDVEAIRLQVRAELLAEQEAERIRQEAAVAEALASRPPEVIEVETDEIVPQKSHPWFRKPSEWFGDR